jgi:hypothetical protein
VKLKNWNFQIKNRKNPEIAALKIEKIREFATLKNRKVSEFARLKNEVVKIKKLCISKKLGKM